MPAHFQASLSRAAKVSDQLIVSNVTQSLYYTLTQPTQQKPCWEGCMDDVCSPILGSPPYFPETISDNQVAPTGNTDNV